MRLLVGAGSLETSFLSSVTQLLVLNVDETITCLLCLHQLEPFEVTDQRTLLPIDNFLCPCRLFPLLCDLSLLPGLHDGALAGRRTDLDDIFGQVKVLERDGTASDTAAGTIHQSLG